MVAPVPSAKIVPVLIQKHHISRVSLGAQGEYDVTDSDIEEFYQETISGSGGDPPKGSIVADLIVKHFYGEFTPQGFKRYSGLWKGPPPGTVGKRDIAEAMKIFSEQLRNPMFVSKGGPGKDESEKVEDDGKGWIWFAADMSPGGLGVELYRSVPIGKRPLLVAKADNVDEMLNKVNWDAALKRIDLTMGGPTIKQR